MSIPCSREACGCRGRFNSQWASAVSYLENYAKSSMSTVPVGDLGSILGLSREPKLDFTTEEHKLSGKT